MEQNCPLCSSKSEKFINYRNKIYYSCTGCLSIFVDPSTFLKPDDEKGRYLEHNNDVFDQGYREFVSPLFKAVTSKFTPNHQGLDFGSGTGPVVSQMLHEVGYSIKQYDPFFENIPELLKLKYDYIVCGEVIEHFYFPHKEFELLRSMLKPNGELICMTNIYSESVDFLRWKYKDDPTHVFFYHQNAFEFILKEFGFSNLQVENRLVQLTAD
jgi:SAM-dependent methyltransferase